jgi:hypothetical protein
MLIIFNLIMPLFFIYFILFIFLILKKNFVFDNLIENRNSGF